MAYGCYIIEVGGGSWGIYNMYFHKNTLSCKDIVFAIYYHSLNNN